MKKQMNMSIRFDEPTLRKFQHVARYEDRSASRQIMYLIHKCIRDFEKEHGDIVIETSSEVNS